MKVKRFDVDCSASGKARQLADGGGGKALACHLLGDRDIRRSGSQQSWLLRWYPSLLGVVEFSIGMAIIHLSNEKNVLLEEVS